MWEIQYFIRNLISYLPTFTVLGFGIYDTKPVKLLQKHCAYQGLLYRIAHVQHFFTNNGQIGFS